MGKTAAGAVWLNADLVSPYDYWQYWRNTEDGDVARFLKLFTVLPLDEIAGSPRSKAPEINEAKKVLATEATALVHGRAAADAGRRAPRARPSRKARSRENLPTRRDRARRTRRRASACSTAFVDRPGSSPRTARRAARSRPAGCKVNDATVTDEKMMLTPSDLTPEGVIKLSLGKKRHVLLKPV